MRKKKLLEDLPDVAFPVITPALQRYTLALQEFLVANMGHLSEFRYNAHEQHFEWCVESGAFVTGQWTVMTAWFYWDPALTDVHAQLDDCRARRRTWRDTIEGMS